VVCIFYEFIYGFFFNDKIAKVKKNLIFWFAHGQELLTYT
jgi:hypothetical protein